jgi:orotate phosphoribosyltransferase
MHAFQLEFIEFAIRSEALRFGNFTLKSGRTSPYFFNTGQFASGARLRELGRFYAAALEQSQLDYDMLYGPAYKGIPLSVATAIALAEHYAKDVAYAFNRKEAKDHGEGGWIVGAPLHGRVVIVDDVITSGSSVQESVSILTQAGATPCAVLIALDRQEPGPDGQLASSAIQRRYAIPVFAIATMTEVIAYLKASGGFQEELKAIESFRASL